MPRKAFSEGVGFALQERAGTECELSTSSLLDEIEGLPYLKKLVRRHCMDAMPT
jgi:hypothetical protein